MQPSSSTLADQYDEYLLTLGEGEGLLAPANGEPLASTSIQSNVEHPSAERDNQHSSQNPFQDAPLVPIPLLEASRVPLTCTINTTPGGSFGSATVFIRAGNVTWRATAVNPQSLWELLSAAANASFIGWISSQQKPKAPGGMDKMAESAFIINATAKFLEAGKQITVCPSKFVAPSSLGAEITLEDLGL